MKRSSYFQSGLRTTSVSVVFILSILLAGCTSLVEKGALPEVVSRQPPDVQLGADLLLFDKPAILSSILIDKKGAAHVFAVDQDRQLYHLEIIDDKIITREFLDKIENKHTQFIDAVEYPPGKLRVLAGDKQYIHVAPNGDWNEIERNR